MIRAVFEPNRTQVIADASLYQWDYGQQLAFVNADLPSSVEVHFAVYGHTLTRIGITVDGNTVVQIPDEMLTYGHTITAYAFMTDEQSGKMVRVATIQVVKRPKPVDYTPPTEAEESLFRATIEQARTANGGDLM